MVNYDHPKCPVDSLTENPSSWENASLLTVEQITPGGLRLLCNKAGEMRRLVKEGGGGDNRLQHKVLSLIFYEASTRTSCSFQAAMHRLGGRVIHVDASPSTGNSSSKKGESLEDTLQCMECYSDVTVLRHPIQGSLGRVISRVNKPVLNAGDGVGEHPTQALLDLFTIFDELGGWENIERQSSSISGQPLKIVLLGDLKHGRTVHSLAKLVARSRIVKDPTTELELVYCSPPSLKMPQEVQDYVARYGVKQTETSDLKEAVADSNVLYVTRIQKERFEVTEEYDAHQAKGLFVVDEDLMKVAPESMIVMHPLPRVDEIATEVDSDPRAAYFRQMENGMFVRMALLDLVLAPGRT
jgi:aspartate carbamoyltransferase